jgi:hypothetical protein
MIFRPTKIGGAYAIDPGSGHDPPVSLGARLRHHSLGVDPQSKNKPTRVALSEGAPALRSSCRLLTCRER